MQVDIQPWMNSCLLANNTPSCDFRSYLSDWNLEGNKIGPNQELRSLSLYDVAWDQLVALLLIHILEHIRQLFTSCFFPYKSVQEQIFFVYRPVVVSFWPLIITSPITKHFMVAVRFLPYSFFAYHSPDIPPTCGRNLTRRQVKKTQQIKMIENLVINLQAFYLGWGS